MNKLYNITTKHDLANALNVQAKDLSYILYVKKVESYYTTFKIEKKSGGYRIINAPTGELKYIQKQLASILEKSINKKSNLAHGFIKNKSVYTNASIHRNKRFVLNVDLSNFFDSFHFGRVRGYLIKNKNFLCTEEIATIVAQITCYNGKLPQGAPSSPVLTNLICGSLDYRLSCLAKKYKVNFTRYADDITFSTNNIYFLRDYDSFMNELLVIINKSGFNLNDKKTRLQFKDSRQEVTGVVVNKIINAPREFYKKTRAMAYSYYVNQECEINGKTATLDQIEGRFGYINNFDKLNNIKYFKNVPLSDKSTKKKSFKEPTEFNSRESDYRQFLFYKYFYMNDKPLIITEGKTDIMYLKAALKAMPDNYNDLYNQNHFRIHFFKRTNRLNYIFGINKDGADTLKNFYGEYFKYNKYKKSNFKYFTQFGYYPKNPIIILLDNETDNNHPLGKFFPGNEKETLVKKLKKDKYIRLNELQNVYLTTIPNNSNNQNDNVEIEDLFEESLLNIELNGRKFYRKGKKDGCFTKDEFSKYVFSNYKTINFDNFKCIFDIFQIIIKDYQDWLEKIYLK